MIEELLLAARSASLSLLRKTETEINDVLLQLADALEEDMAQILAANQQDLSRVDRTYAFYDRLLLNEDRIHGIASDMRNVASLPSPLGKVLMDTVRPNGMRIRKVSVPFGVIGVIYEARPNVTPDVFSLCLKAGSACVLKGGKEAADTNEAIVRIIHRVLGTTGFPEACCTLLPNDHEATNEMLNAVGKVDLVIPRGSARLINFVRDNSRIPVIETGAGVCHTYFDKDGDLTKGAAIVYNGKTRRVSVCNALDCLVIHRQRLNDLPALVEKMQEKNVIIFADEDAYQALEGKYPAHLLEHATPEHFGMEMLDYKMAIRTVSTIEEALEHIARYSSKHSEAIVSEDEEALRLFRTMTDAACVYTNLPTSWTDGAQFGFGAEIGISTQKLHARGPMALPEITTYKYIIEGDGQVRG